MLNRPTDKQLSALARIARGPEGMDLLGLLEGELKRHLELLLDQSGDAFLRTQGAAKKLNEIIDLLRESPQLAEKVRRS